MKLSVSLALLLAATAAFAIPSRRQQIRQQSSSQETDRCSTRCTGVKNKFHYLPGSSYTYRLDTLSKVRLVGSSRPESSLRQTADVSISVIQPCEFSLKLSNYEIQGHEDGAWKTELERRPLRFSFDDGVIQEICPDTQEPAWVLNIKRAILSTFQNALEGRTRNSEFYETDVSGKCPTKYEITKDRRSEKTILKRKDLIKCSEHRGNYSGIRGMQYNVNSKLQNAPLVDSNQECTHVINRRILKQATCTEKHSLQPFRGSGSDASAKGIIAEVTQKLEYVASRKENVQTPVGPKKSLKFDHSEFEFVESAQSTSKVLSILRALKQSSSNDVRPETPGLFTELVYGLRKMSFSDLDKIFNDVRSGKLSDGEKKFFFDAIPACGTDACVQLMVRVIRSGTLPDSDSRFWTIGMALIPKPTLGMVGHVAELVDSAEPNALLGISSLVHGYCKQNPRCAESAEVQNVMTKLTNKLGDKCRGVRSSESTGIHVLKAIGNIGHVQSAVPILIGCIKEDQNSIEIRLAAIQAMRRMPCGQQENDLMSLFRDSSENIEIRLVSFMTLMKCPSEDLIRQVKVVLESESVTQVGSFVWSYLKEKSSTSDPNQRALYDLLKHHPLSSKFNRDPRKFSRFYEFGKFMEQMNIGAHGESGVIMEPDGYLPRQGFFNFTVHLFGNSVNLFEIGGRTRGLERLKDRLFGPDGYFTNPTGYYYGQSQRQDHSSSRVKKIHDLFTSRRQFSEEFSMSTYLKIFGDDLMYFDIQNENMMEEIKNMANTEKLMQYLSKQRNVKISKNILFLDSTMTIPTISGIPLRLALNGTASINIEYGGKMDFTKLIRRPHNEIEILGQIKPSAAIEVSSSMAWHVGEMKTGVRMIGRMHTSTAATGSITLKDGEFKMKLELPDNQMEVIDIQTETLHIVKNQEIRETGGSRDSVRRNVCSPQGLNRVVGLKVCGLVQYSRNPENILISPMRAKISVEKDDPSLRSYEMTAKYTNRPGEHEFEFGLNTPGSRVDREVKAKVEYKQGEKVEAELKVPGKEFQVMGRMSGNQHVQEGELSLTVDNSKTYAMTTKFEKTVQAGRRRTYSVESEVRIPNRESIKFTGNAQAHSKRYSVDFNLEGLYDQPVEGKAKWEQPETQSRKFNSELMFKCPAIHVDLKSHGEADPSGSLQYQYTVEYKRARDTSPHKITASQKQAIERSGESQLKITSTSTFDSSWYPSWNAVTKYQMTKDANLFENRLNIQYSSPKKSIDAVQTTRISQGDLYTTDLSLSVSQARLNHEAQIVYQNRFPEKFLTRVSCPTFKDFKGEVRMENSNARLWQFEGEAKAEYTGREMRLYKEIKELSPSNYESQAVVQWQKGKQLEIDGSLKLESSRGAYEYELSGEAKVSGRPASDKITFFKRFKLTRDETKYVAWAKKGQQSLYDLKMDLLSDPNSKTNFHAYLKSQYFDDFDYAVSGTTELNDDSSEISALVKKDKKDWMKGEIIAPRRVNNAPEVRVKAHLFWDMHTSSVKELMCDYKLTRSSDERQHSWQAKIKTDTAHYLLVSKVVKNDYYTMNTTLHKNNRPMMEANWGGKVSASFMALDFKVKTHAPLRAREFAGLLVHNHRSNGFKTAGYLQRDSDESKKMAFDLEMNRRRTSAGGQRLSGKIMAQINEKQISNEGFVVMAMSRNAMNVNGENKLKVNWDENKEVTVNKEFQITPQVSSLKADMQTPFTKLSKMNVEIRVETPQTNPKVTAKFLWNRNKKILAGFTGQLNQPQSLDLNLELESSFENLKKLEGKLKYDVRGNWDVETFIKWNSEGLVKFVHKTEENGGKYEAELGAWCVIPRRVNWVGKSEFEYDANSKKFDSESSLRLDGQNYKLSSDVDINRKTGEITVESPFDNLKSATLKISKSANNQYLIETARNGAEAASVSALIKMDRGDHEVKFEVDGVQTPFSLIYEGLYNNNIWKIKTEVNTNMNSPTKKTYGIQLSDEKKSNGRSESELVVKHPRRQMKGKMIRIQNAQQQKITLELQPNMANNREPTKIEYTHEKRSTIRQHEVKISDPSLENDITMAYKMDKSGCRSADLLTGDCQFSNELKIDYSGQPEKVLTLKSKFIAQPMSGRQVSRGQRDGEGGRKIEGHFEIEHQATNLYSKLFVSCVPRTFSAGVQYKNDRRQMEQYKGSLEYSPNMDMISLNVESPADQWTLRYSVLTGSTYQVMVLRNGQPAYDMVVTYSRSDKILRLEIKKSSVSEVLFHASAQLTNADTARVRVWHTEDGVRIDDSEFVIRLSRADILNTKCYVRPGFSREINHVSREKWNHWRQGSRGRSNQMAMLNSGMDSLRTRGSNLQQDIKTHTEPLVQYVRQERRQMVSEMGPAMEEVSEQLRIFWQMSKELICSILDVAGRTMDQIMDTVPSESLKQYYSQMKESLSSLPETIQEMMEPISESWEKVSELMQDISEKMSSVKRTISQKLNLDQVRDRFRQTVNDLRNSDLIRTCNDWYERTLQTLTGMSPSEVYQRYYRKVERGVGRMTATGGQLWAEWREWIMEYDGGRELVDWAGEMGSKMKSSYRYIDPEDKFENILVWLRELLSSYNPSTDAGWNRFLPTVKVNDPETGQYEMDIPLPVKVHSLEHLVSHAHPNTLRKLSEKVQRRLNVVMSSGSVTSGDARQGQTEDHSGSYSVWDTVYQYKPVSWQPIKWLPPYESTAYLIGGHHFVTFDGHVYDFMANCEYLLARDFHDKKFTITAAFKQNGRMAEMDNIKVHTSGHLIEIPREGKVKVDNQEKELPWHKLDEMEGLAFVTVVDKNYAIKLKTHDGLKVKCTKNFFMCSITLPGHYHAKTSGLLGSNDNEPGNDMIDSNGEMSENLDDFASSWHIGGGSCVGQRNMAPIARVRTGVREYTLCNEKFMDNNSPFRACFRQVKPGPYMAMCTVDMQTFGGDAWCNISAAYIAACKHQGVPLAMPRNCVKCSTPKSEDLSEGENTELTGSELPRSADVIFAVEERPCMKQVQGKLVQLARKLKDALRTKQIQSVRYGVVGFNGEGVHHKPHFHTGNGQLNMDNSGLQIAVNQLAMDQRALEVSIPIDPMRALNFVAERYPFRPAVQKIVILATCTECGSKTVGYYDLQTKLLERGIMLHVITNKAIELDRGSSENFIGLDAHSLFTLRGSNAEKRGNLVEPHDSCTILAQESNGTVITGVRFRDSVVERMTSEMGKKVLPMTCQLCECQIVKLSPITVCYPCDVPRPVSLTNGDKFFNIPYLKLKKTAQETFAQIA